MLLLYLSWWLFWAFVQTIVLHRFGFSWRLALIDAGFSNLILAILAFLAILIYSFYQPGKNNNVFRLLFAFVIAILFCQILSAVLNYVIPTEIEYLVDLEKSMPLRCVFALMILSFVTILNWMWSGLQEQKEIEQRRNESEQLSKEAELAKLRQQLQPHFLFNSLNSISALALSKPEEARKMIQQLSDFLRGTLKKDEQRTVPMTEELTQLDLYLEIEKVRFGHRLKIEIELAENAKSAMIPPLILQPLVENAIKFGLYGTVHDVVLKIKASVENHNLIVEVINPFDADQTDNVRGTGFGLSSIEKRLFLLYGRNDLLATKKNSGYFTSTLRIPQ